jgi:phage shock protein A
MNDKIEEAKRKKGLLVAQAKRAEASKTINKTMSGLNDASAFDAFDRMAEKVENLEAEAQAAEDLADDYQGGDSLEKEIKSLNTAPATSDALAALKAKMGKAPAAPAASTTSANSLANVQSWDDL